MQKTNLNFFYVFLFAFILLSLTYSALTTKALELDSVAYHIPLAEKFLNGTLFNKTVLTSPFHYYPAASELILSFLIFFHLPLNLFNIFGLLFLTGGVYLLSKRVDIALATLALPVWFRIVTTQSVDAWLVAYIIYIVALLESDSKKKYIPFALGLLLGLLMGTKYSGLLYAGAIGLIYFKQIRSMLLSFSSVIQFAIPLCLLGISWYVRNYSFTGNFIYPFGTTFSPTQITSLSLLLTDRYGAWKIIQAIFSEFSLLGFVPFFIAVYVFRKSVSPFIRRFIMVGLFNMLFFLFLPSSSEGIVSSMRYFSAGMIPLIVGFLLTIKNGEILTLCSVVATLPQLTFHPKLGMSSFILVFSFYHLNKSKLISLWRRFVSL